MISVDDLTQRTACSLDAALAWVAEIFQTAVQHHLSQWAFVLEGSFGEIILVNSRKLFS